MSSDILQQLVTVYLAQINSSMKISEILTNHSEDEEITPDALITGLVYRLMVPMNPDEMEETLTHATDTMNDFINGNDEDNDEENDEYVILEREPRKIKHNTCNCKICSKARDCLSNYHMHICDDPLAQKFKDSITHSCQIHNLII